ncbi:MAG: nickel-dependent hydrogenase large subunit [Thiotrichales bacterium]
MLYGPFNRVEGDLEVEVEIEDGKVASAWVNSPLYRGFEQILQGKPPEDALVYTPRICGICSVSQSMAAARALADTLAFELPRNAELVSNLVLACENLADHLSHFYLFFMPDFARDSYADHDWHAEIATRFRAQTGTSSAAMLRARAELMHITGILAGKWPHTLSLQPGGVITSAGSAEKVQLLAILQGFREYLETVLFGDRLEAVAELDSAGALEAWADAHGDSDFGRFLMLAESLGLDTLGVITPEFMSFGAYTQGGANLFSPGVWREGKHQVLDSGLIREDLSHSWMLAQNGPKHPWQGNTQPDPEQADGYSWCKAPRYNGRVMEVGAQARQVVGGHPLMLDLVAAGQSNVRNRVVGRLLELARVLPAMEQWVRQINPAEPFRLDFALPYDAEGQGVVEAARGSLGHWIRLRKGRILNYQIIAPTTWNFSPRDANSTPGALEQALVGTPVGDQGKASVAIQHVVRSFDPCMVCTVH